MIGIAQTISRTSSRAPRRLSAKINLIPYNTVEGLEWSRPSRARQEKFQSILRKHGVIATCAARRATTSPPPAVSYDYRRSSQPERERSDRVSDIEHVAIGDRAGRRQRS